MVSAFFGLNTGLRALLASQLALDTAAHNAANAATEGYSRQRVVLAATDPYSYPGFNRPGLPGQVGTGVSAATISRVRDAFVDLQLRQETSRSGAWDTRSELLQGLQAVFPEPASTGLGSSLAQFWNSWEDLAADPTSPAARSAVLQQAAGLAGDMNRTSNQIGNLILNTDDAVRQGIAEINAIAGQIASLNGEISRVLVTGDQPNDLMDQRDLLFDKLSALVPASFEPQRDGSVKVTIGGADLVSGVEARALTGVSTPTGVVPSWSDTGASLSLGTGKLGQLVQLRDTDLPAYRARLDTLAAGIAAAVNGLHQSGRDQDGNPGLAVFVASDGGAITAATISLNSALAGKPRLLAVAAAAGTPGDGSIAAKISDLQAGTVVDGQKPNDFYASLVGEIGADTAHAITMAKNQDLVRDHLASRRESISGVSLDEEATEMIKYQHMYQAAARVITTMDQMLDTIINSMGVVGR
jgi:flagellar hook-associated protein 1